MGESTAWRFESWIMFCRFSQSSRSRPWYQLTRGWWARFVPLPCLAWASAVDWYVMGKKKTWKLASLLCGPFALNTIQNIGTFEAHALSLMSVKGKKKVLDSCQLALRLLCPLSWSNHLGSFACQPSNINWRLLLVQLSYWSNKTVGQILIFEVLCQKDSICLN